MKKVKYIFLFLTIISLVLASCTSEDQDDSVTSLKTIVETSEGGNVTTTSFVYNGAEIASIEDNSSLKTFKYTAGLITAIETTNKSTSVKTSVDYFYMNGDLIKVEATGDYMINYVHNNDGTVSFEKFDISVPNVETKMYHGVLTLSGGNIIKVDRTDDNVAAGVISKYSVTYGYDAKANPLHDIVGYEKLLDQEGIVSLNNYVVSTVETSIESNGQIISSASYYKNTFEYNNGNYPTAKKSLVSIPHKGITLNLDATYNY